METLNPGHHRHETTRPKDYREHRPICTAWFRVRVVDALVRQQNVVETVFKLSVVAFDAAESSEILQCSKTNQM